MRWSLSKKLGWSFGLIICCMIGSAIVVSGKANEIATLDTRINDLRQPTTASGERMRSGINASLAGLRGFMLLGSPEMKAVRQEAWLGIDSSLTTLHRFAKNWTDPENIERLEALDQVLAQFGEAQANVEHLAAKGELEAATLALGADAAPHAKRAMEILGEMGESQQALLEADMQKLSDLIHEVGTLAFLIAGLSSIFAIIIGVKITRGITHSAQQMVTAGEAISHGDLSQRVRVKSSDEMGQLANTFERFSGNLNRLIGEFKSGAATIDSSSVQISQSSQSLASVSAEQAATLEEISAAISELTNRTLRNSKNASEATSISSSASKAAHQGQDAVKRMATAISNIQQSSTEVSKVVEVIENIAFQTNLLALNAAVEAARAGEAGSGFAVVAEEVRNLAKRSADAARETNELISNSVTHAKTGVEIADQVEQALGEIVESTGSVNDLITEIAFASEEQAQGLSQIESGMSELDKSSQEIAGSAEELASTSQSTVNLCGELTNQVNKFKLRSGDQNARNSHEPTVAPTPIPEPASALPARQATTPPAPSSFEEEERDLTEFDAELAEF